MADATIECFGRMPLAEELGAPHWVGRQWAVTTDGLERKDGFYFIAADRLEEKRGELPEWPLHMVGKRIDFDDFMTAFLVALVWHGKGAVFTAENISEVHRACRKRLARRAVWDEVEAAFLEERAGATPSLHKNVFAYRMMSLEELQIIREHVDARLHAA